MLIRAIHTDKRVIEEEMDQDRIASLNREGYNIYYYPNYPKNHTTGFVTGDKIDTFNYVFVDCDLKDGVYSTKEAFIDKLDDITPSRIVDSGNGVHAYWKVSDLDGKSFLRLNRRLARLYNTDLAVSKLNQLMRLPGTVNQKHTKKKCEELASNEDLVYTCEELDKLLPPLLKEDEEYATEHYNNVFNTESTINVDAKLPKKFGELLQRNQTVKDLFVGEFKDRSKADYKLGAMLVTEKFTRTEVIQVLMHANKAMERSLKHQLSYAAGIADSLGATEEIPLIMSKTVADILSRNDERKDNKFPCYAWFDGSEHGFRLGQVIGLCAGVGVGKTAIGLNMFLGFTQNNPDYDHVFVTLEQPDVEIADRWAKMTQGNQMLNHKVHVLSNYNEDGSYRDMSIKEIQDFILKLQASGKKIGCVCIDHVGVLRQERRPGEYQGLSDVCKGLKSFAQATNTLLVVLSQTNRAKAGIGDLELDKDAAFGTMNFESYMDFLIVAWQPLKRSYDNPACPRITSYKFAKVRFKGTKDKIHEDSKYRLLFEQETGLLRCLTQDEKDKFKAFEREAIKRRQQDRITDEIEYTELA